MNSCGELRCHAEEKVIPKEEIDGEVEECEGGGTRKTSRTNEEKAEKKRDHHR